MALLGVCHERETFIKRALLWWVFLGSACGLGFLASHYHTYYRPHYQVREATCRFTQTMYYEHLTYSATTCAYAFASCETPNCSINSRYCCVNVTGHTETPSVCLRAWGLYTRDHDKDAFVMNRSHFITADINTQLAMRKVYYVGNKFTCYYSDAHPEARPDWYEDSDNVLVAVYMLGFICLVVTIVSSFVVLLFTGS